MLSFHELMRHRVQRILLVSSLYDSFVMSEEGHLHETLLGHFMDLNRTSIPDVVRVPSIQAAGEELERDSRFDLVVSSLTLSDGDAAELASMLRTAGHGIPVIALAYTNSELHEFNTRRDTSQLERIFLWQGDVRIFLAIVMYLEDRLNVAGDSGEQGVPVIIVVEDSVRFYSSFLPAIYTSLLRHTDRLLSDDLNVSQKVMRMRGRPKVLLCTSFEEAWDFFERYDENVLGIISDFEYPKDGTLQPEAGLELCKRVHVRRPDLRLVLQSSKADNEQQAHDLGASFLLKGSPVLLQRLQRILVERFGFGDFIFRGANGEEVDRARDLRTLSEKVATLPAAVVSYHAERNHFSNWFKARTEFALAERLRPVQSEEFETPEHLRAHLIDAVRSYRRERQRTIIADFDRLRFEPTVSMTRIGSGALGGKARGLAFTNRVLRIAGVDERFPEIDIHVPPTIALGTDVFDQFLEYGFIHDFAIEHRRDRDITRLFADAPFPRDAGAKLRSFLQRVKYPLAVRSSSLLEDSLSQPFAGVYQTVMIPNNDPELDVRWRQLTKAIQQVYASTFLERAKSYLEMTSYRLEEEKMAVMVQQLVGIRHGRRFYPDFAGVARSHNFYPAPGHAAEDGVVAVALGLGQTVVGGDNCLRFCPRYPRQIMSFSSVSDALRSSQREFHALDLEGDLRGGSLKLTKYPLEAAEKDGPLAWLGSVYSADDDRIVDGVARAGPRLVSFAQVLKHGAFPLAEITRELLERCTEGTGAPVEIEFAGNLPRPGRRAEFAFLQLRPLATAKEGDAVDLSRIDRSSVICHSSTVLGNGRHADIRDLVVVDAATFERHKSREIALQVAEFDALLRKERKPYILIGVGRWGSSDPHLGIPVSWNQIAGARVIVEAGFKDIKVEPSQGTHFFQNLTSSHVGYFTVNPELGDGALDWEWLATQPALGETDYLRHVRLDSPCEVRMNGRRGEGVIFRTEP